MADPSSLDDMLDEALDELDDSGDEHEKDVNKKDVKQQALSKPPLVETVSEGLKDPADTTHSSMPTNDSKAQASSSPSAAAVPTDPSLAFQKMLRDFMEADDNPNGDDGDIGQFMQQVQSQLQQNKPKKDETDKFTAKDKSEVEDTIAAILGEMAKASLEDTTTDTAGGNDNTPYSEEERMLQEMFKNLAGNNFNPGEMLKDGGMPDMPDDFNPDAFMDGMMEQLLSKDLMYEPMKLVCAKFPQWLEDHKEQLTAKEWESRNKQYKVFQDLVASYEDGSGGSGKLMDLMIQVQEYGQPPEEIISEIAPGLELDEEGLPKMGTLPFLGQGAGENGECRIM